MNLLLKTYNSFVLSDMSLNQYPMQTITPLLRTSSFYISSDSYNTNTNSLFSIPASLLESINQSQTSFLSSTTSAAVENQNQDQSYISFSTSDVIYPLSLSISQVQSSSLISDSTFTNQTIFSHPLNVIMESNPCNENSQKDCLMNVLLQNKNHQKSSIYNKLNTSFEIECYEGLIETHNISCKFGDMIKVYCNGSFSGRFKGECPSLLESSQCNLNGLNIFGNEEINNYNNNHYQGLSCKLSHYNISSTLCICNLSFISTIIKNNNLNGGLSNENNEISFSIQSIGKSILSDFIMTWKSTSSLSSSEVSHSWTVLLTVGGLGLIFLLLLLFSEIWDNYQKKEMKKPKSIESELEEGNQMKRENKLSKSKRKFKNNNILSVGITSSQQEFQRRGKVNEDFNLIEDSLPLVFRSKKFWNKLFDEMKVYHRWLGIIFYYSPEFPRSMRVLSLFSSIVVMLFIQSLVYNIADPDDGSCESCKSESKCLSLKSTLNSSCNQSPDSSINSFFLTLVPALLLSLKSTLNSNEDRCYWESNGNLFEIGNLNKTTEFNGSCHFKPIDGDITRMCIVAIFSAVVSAPLSLSIQYLISEVLSKESHNSTLFNFHQRKLSQKVGVDINENEKNQPRLRQVQSSKLKLSSSKSKSAIFPDFNDKSNAGNSVRKNELIEESGDWLQDDYKNLLRELHDYYEKLKESRDESKIKEIQGIFHLMLIFFIF